MKTKSYNPSDLEVQIAQAITKLSTEIESELPTNQIIKIDNQIEMDNPMVRLDLLDDDGDPHEVVIKIIQVPDKF